MKQFDNELKKNSANYTPLNPVILIEWEGGTLIKLCDDLFVVGRCTGEFGTGELGS